MKDIKLQIRIDPEVKLSWVEFARGQGITLTSLIEASVNNSICSTGTPRNSTDDAFYVRMVESALRVGTRENWDTVKKTLAGEGYDWNIATRTLIKKGVVIKRF